MAAQYSVGIDLGTTNSVLAFTRFDPDVAPGAVELFPIPQIVSAANVEARSVLPSFLYLASEPETASGAYELPWGGERAFAAGEFARGQAAAVPARTVAAADILRAVQAADRALITDATVFDIYEGAGIPDDHKSVAVAVTLQPTEKTLTDAEIEAVAGRIVAEVAKKTGATLRENDLEVREDVADVSTLFITNRAAWKLRADVLGALEMLEGYDG